MSPETRKRALRAFMRHMTKQANLALDAYEKIRHSSDELRAKNTVVSRVMAEMLDDLERHNYIDKMRNITEELQILQVNIDELAEQETPDALFQRLEAIQAIGKPFENLGDELTRRLKAAQQNLSELN